MTCTHSEYVSKFIGNSNENIHISGKLRSTTNGMNIKDNIWLGNYISMKIWFHNTRWITWRLPNRQKPLEGKLSMSKNITSSACGTQNTPHCSWLMTSTMSWRNNLPWSKQSGFYSVRLNNFCILCEIDPAYSLAL